MVTSVASELLEVVMILVGLDDPDLSVDRLLMICLFVALELLAPTKI
jgi:hypothetical protein